MVEVLPVPIAAAVCGRTVSVLSVAVEDVRPSTGAATGADCRLRAELVLSDGRRLSETLIRKEIRPLTSGRHARLAGDPRHWAYWRREAEAYTSGLLPAGPALRAPRCFGVVDQTVFLEDVAGPEPTAVHAAEALARWQVEFEPSLDRPWLAVDQIGKRLASGDLDWGGVDADPRVVELWKRRHTCYERLARLPRVLSHGDYSIGTLVSSAGEVVAFDWATLGWEPVGFDLAHLALSAAENPLPGYRPTAPTHREVAEIGFRCALTIIGASRVHWMLSNSVEVPRWCVDFLWDRRPPES